jgi:mannose/cellobiose epimerase-like protein (N-acyl-D-glucosamine 2-epimerase family)
MNIGSFEFSDTISGYVTEFNGEGKFKMQTSDGREYEVILGANLYARLVRNLNEPYADCTGQIKSLLKPGQMVFVYGVFYPNGDHYIYEAKVLDFPGTKLDKFRFEESDWWANQAAAIADFFVNAQFGGPEDIDYSKYRTSLALTGEHKGGFRQETDTVSRLVFGFASAFLLTGNDVFLEAAEKGTQYLQDHMKFYDVDENIVYWYHGIDVKEGKEHKVFTSEFGDDYDAIPMYEQIYALAGPTQTYRITGNPSIMKDIDLTMDLFEKFYHDNELGGYFSHIDPIMLDPRSESLGPNKARKNWNSVGDHAPAYLINLCLATGKESHYKFLEYTADTITKYFQDYDNSPYVNEKFFEDWSHDIEWGWQQNRGVVGHNLKIAWNLMRVNSYYPKDSYVEFSRKIAKVMPEVGMDIQRFGWYDVMERKVFDGEEKHRFAWHDRKAWWQQEQGILAYQIMYGLLGDEEYLKLGRESTAFYNTYFLDHDDGAVYFNVLNNGIPYLLGTERLKGSHSMSGYHSIELAYLAAVYTNLLNTKKPLDMYFKPVVGGFEDNILRVSPDILPKGSIKITKVMIDGKEWDKYDADELTVELPDLDYRAKIKVTLTPQ